MLTEKAIQDPFRITTFFTAFTACWDENFSFAGESHAQYEVVFVAEGGVEATEEERVYRLETGDMILHTPWEFHRIRSLRGTAPRVYIFTFRAVGRLPESVGDGVLHLSEDKKNELTAAFSHVKAFLSATDSAESEGALAAASVAAFLLSLGHPGDVTKPADRDTGIAAEHYRDLIRIMKTGVCENLSLAEIAGRSHLSQSYMKDLFSAYAGISPGKYYNRLQCLEAERLLADGIPVYLVAEKMNFSSPNYFSLFFKRERGYSPTAALRKQGDR